jgi:hypothetical protein
MNIIIPTIGLKYGSHGANGEEEALFIKINDG